MNWHKFLTLNPKNVAAIFSTATLIYTSCLVYPTLAIATNNNEYKMAQVVTCQKVVIDDPDGYINVRSTPEVKANNIVRSLLNGTQIRVLKERSGWLQINSPIQGWVAKNRTAICCAVHNRDIQTSLQTISRLGEQATQGNRSAGESLVKMFVDGAFAESQTVALVKWAGKNPRFLVNILDGQSQALRREVLRSMRYSFDIEPGARKNFEVALAKLPHNNPTVQDWAYVLKR
ncbi:SH3 domain-containing protein [Calothrix sp. UHCC 0171]|uniref:SH3 domain-containing protein n=1 Tax=Calothrix sp. UHCC 0171 TaxID=3110245 RepID=UPI002B209D70|nr:SH3 domain-containing protein [Calothrix sp. UHCC 0171]MEA5572685.1 SH3 domain-containing protein [Calothrix sp. UHCC 0171]